MTLAAGIQESNRVILVADTLMGRIPDEGPLLWYSGSKFRWCGRNVLAVWMGFHRGEGLLGPLDPDAEIRPAIRVAYDQATANHRSAVQHTLDTRPDLRTNIQADRDWEKPEFLAAGLGNRFGPELVRITSGGEETARNGQTLSVGPWPDVSWRWWKRGTSSRILLLDAMAQAIDALKGQHIADFPLDVWTLVGNDATHERLTKWEVLAAITIEQEAERFLSSKG